MTIGAGHRAFPPEASGRWSLVSSLLFSDPTPTERMAARVDQLLDLYGVLTREAVQAHEIEGGFTAVYGVLKAMEDAGRVRRGYFIAGLGATQFAHPAAADRLRTLRDPGDQPQTLLIAAVDPANPYGAALPWPERPQGRRPMRAAGASVVLIDGSLAAWLAPGERHLLTFLEGVGERDPAVVAAEIVHVLTAELLSGRRRAVFLEEIDGGQTGDGHMSQALFEAGFTHREGGYQRRL